MYIVLSCLIKWRFFVLFLNLIRFEIMKSVKAGCLGLCHDSNPVLTIIPNLITVWTAWYNKITCIEYNINVHHFCCHIWNKNSKLKNNQITGFPYFPFIICISSLTSTKQLIRLRFGPQFKTWTRTRTGTCKYVSDHFLPILHGVGIRK